MPLGKGSSKENCISSAYKTEIAHGKSKKQARAIALSHCSKYWGGISKKKKKNEIEELKLSIMFDKFDVEIIKEKLEKVKKYGHI